MAPARPRSAASPRSAAAAGHHLGEVAGDGRAAAILGRCISAVGGAAPSWGSRVAPPGGVKWTNTVCCCKYSNIRHLAKCGRICRENEHSQLLSESGLWLTQGASCKVDEKEISPDHQCSAAEKNPTTTRKSINTCYSQIRRYLGSKVPAGKVKTKPPWTLHRRCDLTAGAVAPAAPGPAAPGPAAPGPAAPGPAAPGPAAPGPGSRSVPGARLPPAALLPLNIKRDARRALGPALARSGQSAGTRWFESRFEGSNGKLGDALV
ncbi:uncharacterized protein LOC142087299 [Calonectris borealis]|uniref:uncharacterized protein LOC142087299 n=1 Tax=Calonectris borealis TaxID=1323832 RepID=UPI003F4C3ACB